MTLGRPSQDRGGDVAAGASCVAMRHLAIGLAVLLSAVSCGGEGPPTAPRETTPPPPVTAPASIPAPVAPVAGASLANACTGDSWRFDWSDLQASAYHLQVFSPGGERVLDVTDIPASVYTWTAPPVVAESARRGWRWRVQANIGGTWRDWSAEVPFEVDALAPRMTAPAAGAVMDNGCVNRDDGIAWDFAWSGCREADRYHLYVIGANALNPVVDDDRVRTESYQLRSPGSYIVPGNGRAWIWHLRARIDGTWQEPAAAGTFDVEPLDSDCVVVDAPRQIAPAEGAVLDHFPRTITLQWEAVPFAASYSIDLEVCQNPTCREGQTNPWNPPIRRLTARSHTFNFVGAQPGRWRVWAANGSGGEGPKSGWREFRFTR